MNIRLFRKDDAPSVSKVVEDALRQTNSKDCPSETIEKFVKQNSPQYFIKKSGEREIYVVEKDERIVATGGWANNWILSFYVDPNYQGQRIGAFLMRFLERKIIEAGFDKVFIPSGFTALGFYGKCGYNRSEDQTHATKDWVILEKKFPSIPIEV